MTVLDNDIDDHAAPGSVNPLLRPRTQWSSICSRRFGTPSPARRQGGLCGTTCHEPSTTRGQLVFAMLERSWRRCRRCEAGDLPTSTRRQDPIGGRGGGPTRRSSATQPHGQPSVPDDQARAGNPISPTLRNEAVVEFPLTRQVIPSTRSTRVRFPPVANGAGGRRLWMDCARTCVRASDELHECRSAGPSPWSEARLARYTLARTCANSCVYAQVRRVRARARCRTPGVPSQTHEDPGLEVPTEVSRSTGVIEVLRGNSADPTPVRPRNAILRHVADDTGEPPCLAPEEGLCQ